MSGKRISLSGEVHIWDGHCSTVVDCMDALKAIGRAYGLYDRSEELRDCRVMLTRDDHPSLVVQEDASHHGSPLWETTYTITDDPKQIQRYMAFQETLKMFQEIEREQERPATAPQLPSKADKKKGVQYER